ncbi:hypothetical protein [Rhodanobacter sp. A1T4]|uniref:hypothetical protein n=1 Tax=Rhodanobacter sp. A1T4 TaxID=2723087 RepID=UPI00160A7343|nr:hypothetical protein [Rhodanobacter sp. A1T4]MBB6247819.1 hypothetical protein [Rhodanobacter sp. A1T4]
MASSLRHAITHLIQIGIEIVSNQRSSYGCSQEQLPSSCPISPVSPLRTLEAMGRPRQRPRHHPGPIPIRRSAIPAWLTIFWGISDFGDLGGQYSIDGGTSHAMVYHHGQFEPLDPDDMSGEYFDAAGKQHGFIATPVGTQHRK